MAMTAKELNFIELQELKRIYLVEKLRSEGRIPTYGEIRDAGSIPDDEIIEHYGNTVFETNDFFAGRVMEDMDVEYTDTSIKERKKADTTSIEKIRRINRNVVNENGHIESFEHQLLRYVSKKWNNWEVFIVSPNIQNLPYITDKVERPLIMTISTLKHIQKKHPDDYTYISAINNKLADSWIGLDSLREDLPNYKVIISEGEKGKATAAVIDICAEKNEVEICELRTFYNRPPESLVIDTFNRFKNIYCNEKTEDFIKSAGVQFPMEMIELLYKSDYKGVLSKSQSEIYQKILKKFMKEEGSFEAEGYHFYPIMKLSDKENNIKYISYNTTISNSLNIEWNHFYESAGEHNKTYDIFFCLETDQCYIPTHNGLQIWTGPIGRSEEIDLIEGKYRQKYMYVNEYINEKTEQFIKNTRLQLPNSLIFALQDNNIKVFNKSQVLQAEKDRIPSIEERIEEAEGEGWIHREFFTEDQIAEREAIERQYAERIPCGRIDQVWKKGVIKGSDFLNPEEFVKEINDCIYTGVPINVVLYTNNGERIIKGEYIQIENESGAVRSMKDEEWEPEPIRPVTQEQIDDIVERKEPKGFFFSHSYVEGQGPVYTAVDNSAGAARKKDFDTYDEMEDWIRGWIIEQGEEEQRREDKIEFRGQKKIHISLHENYCHRRESETTGRIYNQMTMPKGTLLDGRDIGGYKIAPAFMGKSRYNPNEMVATYYVPADKPLEVKLIKGADFEEVDIEKIKEAVDNQKAAYREAMREQSKTSEKAQNHISKKEKDRDEEL